MRAAREHRWAEPINIGIRSYLRQEISTSLNQDLPIYTQSGATTQVNNRIDKLYGTHNGSARLVAYWWLTTGSKGKGMQFAESQPLASDGYTALVNAQKELLSRLPGDIGSKLKEPRSEVE